MEKLKKEFNLLFSQKRLILKKVVFVTFLLSALITKSQAQQYFKGAGTWNTSNTNWSNTSNGTYNQLWSGGNAVFEQTAGTVTLGSSGVSSTGLTFNLTGFILTGSNLLTLSGSSPTISSTVATTNLDCPISSSNQVIFNGSGVINFGPAAVASSTPFSVSDFSGGFLINQGVTRINGNNNNAFGTLGKAGTIVVKANNLIFSNVGSMTSNTGNGNNIYNAMQLNPLGTSNFNIALGGTKPSASTPAFVLNFNGAITEGGLGATNICIGNKAATGSGGAQGSGATKFSSNLNTYSGQTIINLGNGVFQGGVDNFLPTTNQLVYGDGGSSQTYGLMDLNGFDVTVGSIETNGGTSPIYKGITNSGSSIKTITINGGGTSNSNATFGAIIGSGTITTIGSTSFTGTNNIALKMGANAGNLTLTAQNTFTGGLDLSGGNLIMGVNNALSSSLPIKLNGGTLKTGAGIGYTQTIGTVSLSNNSNIYFGTGSHSLSFSASNNATWNSSTKINIYGWSGTPNGVSGGTEGKVFFGSTSSGLSTNQLSQITFSINGINYNSTILSTGEVVPVCNPSVINLISNNGPICVGSNLELNATASGTINSYSWTGPNNFSSSFQNPVITAATSAASGTYSLTVTNACGANTTSSTVATVNSILLPEISIVSNVGNSICSGTTVSYTAASTRGGTTPSYQWKLNGNNVGSDTSFYSTNSIVNGDKIVCVITSNAQCLSSNTAVSNEITMNVSQTITPSLSIASNIGNTICNGSNVVFTATSINGGASPSYQWKINNNNVGSNSNTFSVNSLSNSDVISCQMTSTNACASPTLATSNIINITVTPLVSPSISISTTSGNSICEGTNVTFKATPLNGGTTPSFQWTKNGINVGTNDSIFSTSSLINNDSIICILTSNAACTNSSTASSSRIKLAVNSLPNPSIIGSSSVCFGDSTILDAGSGYASYLWNNGKTSQTISVSSADNYAVTVSDGNCSGTSNSFPFAVIHIPNEPSSFTSSSINVNKGQMAVVYSVPNENAVNSYLWSYSGSGATINGSGNSVLIDFSAAAINGTLSVAATNNCGTGISRNMAVSINSSDFTPGRLVVLQTSGSTSKASSAITLKEFSVNGAEGVSVIIPSAGSNALQTAGVYGGSEGFLTTSSDGKFLVLAGYGTSTTYTDITATSSSTVPRVVGKVSPSGSYSQVYSSSSSYNLNDIRAAVSDGNNFWASGASVANVDGINYFGPSTPNALGTSATPPKAYALRIFNGQLYYSTQKAGPSNSTSQLGIFSIGIGLQTSGNPSPIQIINTGTALVEDFSINPEGNLCYVAVNQNTVAGGIQKWTKNGNTWSLAYTLGTGVSNIGAYGLIVDYSASNPKIYATTFESTGNRVIAITDIGSNSTINTLVNATTGVFYKGVTFAPVDNGTPTVSLSLSTNAASEALATSITVTANASSAVSGDQTVSLSISGTGIYAADYTLSDTIITIPNGTSKGSVTFNITDDSDIESLETAVLTLSNPSSGILLSNFITQNVSISDNDNNSPSIVINVGSTSNLIDGGALTSPGSPYALSGVKNSPNDPIQTLGIDFLINDTETNASALILNATSSNAAVVPNDSIKFSGTGSIRNIKINPSGYGFSNITLSVSDGITSTSFIINYGNSISTPNIQANNTFWHTGMSDGSDAIALDSNFYMTADDELDVINVYSRNSSGLHLVSYDYSSYLNLPDITKPETDIEAGTKSLKNPGRAYWLGSMSNGKAPFGSKPNRDRLFATNYSGTGANTSFSVIGYSAIKSALIAWGDVNGYNFSSSALAGVDSKAFFGFAAEGMVFAPDSNTLWIGLRAPLVPTINRTKAVIAPILNFEAWFNNGTQSGTPTFGAPIELNLNNNGIRDIIRLSNGSYIIVAGSPDASLTNSIYKWSGNTLDEPILVNTLGNSALNMEGVMEINVSGQLSLSKLQVISDGGSDVIYQDNNEAKDYGILNFRKFRSDILTDIDLDVCSGYTASINASGNTTFCAGDSVTLTASSNANSYLWSNGKTTQSITVKSSGNYAVTISKNSNGCSAISASTNISVSSLSSDFDKNGITNNSDFLRLLGKFGSLCTCMEDINIDGIVNNSDFLILLSQYNHTCN